MNEQAATGPLWSSCTILNSTHCGHPVLLPTALAVANGWPQNISAKQLMLQCVTAHKNTGTMKSAEKILSCGKIDYTPSCPKPLAVCSNLVVPSSRHIECGSVSDNLTSPTRSQMPRDPQTVVSKFVVPFPRCTQHSLTELLHRNS